jgi:hypothetical protein
MSSSNARAPLLRGVSQYEVDFVIPRKGIDLPLAIDPFLLFKSRNPEYRALHGSVLDVFNAGIRAVHAGQLDKARRILTFPEVVEIGLGYSSSSRRGSGVGAHLTELIIDTLIGSPQLQQRGVRHVEEMQLLSAGIGPDRVSDIVANILKSFLVEYTQRQSTIWGIELRSGVPLPHVYNHATGSWEDVHADLPVSDVDGHPILLVPRRVVRVLPWINYDDFLRTEFAAYLAARRGAIRSSRSGRADERESERKSEKVDVVTVTREDLTLVERYVKAREAQADAARPSLDYVDEDACVQGDALKLRLRSMPVGRDDAASYQRIVLEILNYLFNPELIDGQPEVRTVDGTERRDIIFTNDSDEPFWSYLRNAHDSLLVMFETKNMDEVDIAAINQTATYLGDRIGRLGVVVTRHDIPDSIRRKIFSVWNDSGPNRKVILTLTDEQLCELIDLRCKDASPTKWMQKHYRAFRTAVQ